MRAIEQIPDVRKRIEGVYYRPAANTPEEFAAYIQSEIDKWGKVAKDAGIKPN